MRPNKATRPAPGQPRAKAAGAVRKGATSPAENPAFAVVGIGASAGGLEALEHFLSHVPAGSGMAFVIVQHLDPTRQGIMPELLQRATSMKVVQVRDRTLVKPDCVYVIPPNKDMSILRGVLHLFEPASPRGLRLPIDFFLRSLAQDRQERSVAVILSGMGSDGSLGLRAVKERGGVVLVQDPATAKFNGMPGSAVESGLADIVAPVEELPGRILSCLRRPPLVRPSEPALAEKTRDSLDKAVILLRARTGHDFSLYKKSSFYRRIERRMGIHQIGSVALYVRYLQENSQELDLLFKELLIGVTSFFRDSAAWEELRRKVMPALLASRPGGCALRAWVAGCSTGEEAYSLAMVFKEAVDKIKTSGKFSLSIFATDLDKDAIEKARHGLYPASIGVDVSQKRLEKFFVKAGSGYQVGARVREMVVFAPQSLILDPPFTKLDILSCRNLLIYLGPEMQKKLIPLFHYSLNPGGILFLGSAESVGPFADLFKPIDAKLRIFRRTESALRPERVEFPASFSAPPVEGAEFRPASKPQPNLQALADRLILDHYSPPATLVNETGNILYVSGHTGKFLEPAAGKANWNIFAMAREGLRPGISRAFQQALRQKGPADARTLRFTVNGAEKFANVSIQKLVEPGPLHGLLMILFTDATPRREDRPAKGGKRTNGRGASLTGLEAKYEEVCLELRAAREEMQTSQEDLRSINEEMQSTNEELQSTNEELNTSKEEMQSLNEELQTVNTELQTKLDELSRSNNDMKNLLNSTDIATLFLDNDLKVRRFTTQATKIIKLIPGDIGRPVTDLASDLVYPELADEARAVTKTLGFAEKAVNARDGRWFMARIMPYRTLDEEVDGVVITFTDITASKELEARLREKQATLEKRVAEHSATARLARKGAPRSPVRKTPARPRERKPI